MDLRHKDPRKKLQHVNLTFFQDVTEFNKVQPTFKPRVLADEDARVEMCTKSSLTEIY